MREHDAEITRLRREAQEFAQRVELLAAQRNEARAALEETRGELARLRAAAEAFLDAVDDVPIDCFLGVNEDAAVRLRDACAARLRLELGARALAALSALSARCAPLPPPVCPSPTEAP